MIVINVYDDNDDGRDVVVVVVDDDDDDDDAGDDDDDNDDDDGDDDDDDDEGKMMMLMRRMLRRKTDPKTGKHTVGEPAQSKGTWTFHKSHFAQKFTGKMPHASPTDIVLCGPAQSKCTWTFHKSHVVRKFAGKMPDAPDTNSIEHRALIVNYRKNPSVWPHYSSPQKNTTTVPIAWREVAICSDSSHL